MRKKMSNKKELLLSGFHSILDATNLGSTLYPIMSLCPYNYHGYDVTTKSCPVCGQGKLYQMDRLKEDRVACAGWVHPEYGPLSCETYAGLLL